MIALPITPTTDSVKLAKLLARFWAKVDKTKDCWLWTAARDPNGYGRFRLNAHTVKAHRFAYTILVGPIPDGLTLDHLCKVRHCINPAHLEPVTHQENLLRGDTNAARNIAKTYCPCGHPLEGENLVQSELRRGRRACRTCKNAHNLGYKHTKRAKVRNSG